MHRLWKVPYCLRFAPPPRHIPQGYCAAANDSVRKFSTSGGVFTVFANYFLENGGYVCGATFDENWQVRHIIINDKKDLDKLKRSKYVQSKIGKCYKEIKMLLNEGKSVFFSGVPCQVAGLYKYLGNKEYTNLFTIDLYCHSAPSPKVYENLLKEYGIDEIKSIDFRDKSRKGWKGSEFTIKKKDGEIIYNNGYVPLFVNGYFSRKSCYKCNYARLPRVGDITGADFWGADTKKFDIDNKGVSILLVNSLKGNEILQKVKSNFKILEKVPLKAFGINGIHSSYRPLYREEFIKDALQNSVIKCFEKYTDKKVLISNLYFSENYGAVLLGYAMQEIVKSLGYIPYHNYTKSNVISEFRKFINKYIALAQSDDANYLNNNFDNFIVGSDQIWNPIMWTTTGQFHNSLFLNSITPDKKKIAYAASFGVNDLSKCKKNHRLNGVKYYLSRFDYISTREYGGVDICKNELSVDAVKVLEPVFVVDKQLWEKLAQDSKYNKKNENYILTYILDTNKDKEKIISFLANHYQLKVINIDVNKKNYTPQDFVALIKNCEFAVTDSFHGSCFSIIFNKKFVGIYNESRGISRFRTLEKLFHINEKFVYTFESEEQILNALNSKTDWEYIRQIIENDREFSLKWLKRCLDLPKDDSKNPDYYMFSYVQNEMYRILYLILNKNKIYGKYNFYRMLKNITFGNAKAKYHEKYLKYRSLKKDINTVLKNKLNICLEK